MHEELFTNQKALSPTDLSNYAKAVGLDESAFQKCLESGQYAAEIRKDIADAQQAGITGTPGFVLGTIEGNDGKVKALRVLKGAQAFSAFQAAIDSLLAEQKQ